MTAAAFLDPAFVIAKSVLTDRQENARALCLSAFAFADKMAEQTSLAASDIFDALTFIPENMLALLSSPEGWAALAEFVGSELGLGPVGFRPTVH